MRRVAGTSGAGNTTSQQMAVSVGGAVIDPPGIRELEVGRVNLSRTFPGMAVLAGECRFRDCRHEEESGCVVRQAIEEERLLENPEGGPV